MKYQAGDFEAVHLSPVWRSKANFVFASLLEAEEGKNRWEQLWGNRLDTHRFILCCIPFFTNGIGLGDEVETNDGFVLSGLLKSSGQATSRIWFGRQEQTSKLEIVGELQQMGAQIEWYSQSLLGISIPFDQRFDFSVYLNTHEKLGLLQYDAGNWAPTR